MWGGTRGAGSSPQNSPQDPSAHLKTAGFPLGAGPHGALLGWAVRRESSEMLRSEQSSPSLAYSDSRSDLPHTEGRCGLMEVGGEPDPGL